MAGITLAARDRLAGALSVERLSLARAGIGVSMVTQPRLLGRVMGADSAAATRMTWATQMLGARELALGLGTFIALRKHGTRASRLWLMAGVLSDGIDALALTAAIAQGRVSKVTGPVVVATSAGAVYAQLDALESADEA